MSHRALDTIIGTVATITSSKFKDVRRQNRWNRLVRVSLPDALFVSVLMFTKSTATPECVWTLSLPVLAPSAPDFTAFTGALDLKQLLRGLEKPSRLEDGSLVHRSRSRTCTHNGDLHHRPARLLGDDRGWRHQFLCTIMIGH